MKILVAPGAYKGFFTSSEAAQIITSGILDADPLCEITQLPLADGGESTLNILVDSLHGTFKETETTDATGRPVLAKWGLIYGGKKAIIECAQVIGLPKYGDFHTEPQKKTSYGVGKLMLHVLKEGVNEIMVCLGDTSTIDGGYGLAKALGVKFLDVSGEIITSDNLIQALKSIVKIDTTNVPINNSTKFTIAVDTLTPLCGPNGLTYLYGKQKGVKEDDFELFEAAFDNYAKKVHLQFDVNIRDLPGTSAGGGIASTLRGIFGAKIVSGFDMVAEATNLVSKIEEADIVITGEGQVNKQTLFGKVPAGVANICRKLRVPLITITGEFVPFPEDELFAESIFIINDDDLDAPNAKSLNQHRLRISSSRLMKLLKLGSSFAH